MEPAKLDVPAQSQIDQINSILNQRKSATAFNNKGIDQSQQINGTQHANYYLDRWCTKNQTSISPDQEIVFEITPNSNEIISLNSICYYLIGMMPKGATGKIPSTPTYLGYKTFVRERVALNGITIYDSPRDTPAVLMTQRRLQSATNGNWKLSYCEEAITNPSLTDTKIIDWFAMPSFNIFDNPFNVTDLLPRERLTITLSFNKEALENISLISVDCVATGKNLFDLTMAAVETQALSPAHIMQVEGYSLTKTDVRAAQTNVNIHISTTKNQHPNYLLFYHAPPNTSTESSNLFFQNFSCVQNGRQFPTKNIDLQNGLRLFQFKKIVEVFAPGIGFEFLPNTLPFFVKLGETDNIAEKEVADGGPIELAITLNTATVDCVIWCMMFYKADIVIEGAARNTYIGVNNNI